MTPSATYKKIPFLLLIIILGIIELAFPIKPDLLLISMVLGALSFEFKWAFALSVFAGVFKDASGAFGFGLNSLLFGFWSLLIIRLSREVTLDNNLTRAVLIFIIALLHNIITGLVFISSGSLLGLGIFLRITVIGAIYTAAVSWLVLEGSLLKIVSI